MNKIELDKSKWPKSNVVRKPIEELRQLIGIDDKVERQMALSNWLTRNLTYFGIEKVLSDMEIVAGQLDMVRMTEQELYDRIGRSMAGNCGHMEWTEAIGPYGKEHRCRFTAIGVKS